LFSASLIGLFSLTPHNTTQLWSYDAKTEKNAFWLNSGVTNYSDSSALKNNISATRGSASYIPAVMRNDIKQ
jgi:hypothetical protein